MRRDRFVESTVEEYGGVDVLGNNAGAVGDPGGREERRPHIEVERRGRMEKVGPLVALLASAHASFIHGADYRVDGGSVASA